tara:strand:- start:6316 stop:8325 length:2010 start_codon:yes stop_codon:yes gene_type:complete
MDGSFGYGGGRSGGFLSEEVANQGNPYYTGGYDDYYGGGIGGLGDFGGYYDDYYGGGFDDYYGGGYEDPYGGGYVDPNFGQEDPYDGGYVDPNFGQESAPVQDDGSQDPYMAGAQTATTSRDPALQQLLFGLDGQGGFIPGAMEAVKSTFFDEQGRPIITPQEVAGMSQDQLDAMQAARDLGGVQDRFLSEAEQAYKTGIGQLETGQEAARGYGLRGLDATQTGVAEERRLRQSGLEGLLSSLGEGRDLARGATTDLYGRLGEAEGIRRGATDEFGRRLGEAEGIQRGATDQFGRSAGDIARRQIGATEGFGGALGESEDLLRGTTGGYDQSMTEQFFDPYEDRVVQQTVEDAVKQANIADIADTARNIRAGGESAFGSRARLSADERTEALGRGLAKEIAGIRSRGFTEAQRMGTSEFARQKQAERTAASGLAGMAGQRLGSQQQLGGALRGISGDVLGAQRGLASGLGALGSQRFGSQQQLASGLGQTAGQRYGAGTGLGQTLVGFGQTGQQAQAGAGQAALGSAGQLAGAFGQMGGLEGQIGQQRFQAQQGLGGFMQGLGGQAQQAGLSNIGLLSGMGAQQQALQQQILNAQRANALQAQQAPLQQYSALLPFIGTATQTAGTQQTQQQFTPPPSPLMAGLGVGLSTLGGVGSFLSPPQYGMRAPT